MSSQILLSGGDKYYSYSGEIFGDVSVPATISMITIDNTGLRDSYVEIQPLFGKPANNTVANALGIAIKLDNVQILQQSLAEGNIKVDLPTIKLFAPRNSKLEIISLNTSGNNTQIRSATLIGYYL